MKKCLTLNYGLLKVIENATVYQIGNINITVWTINSYLSLFNLSYSYIWQILRRYCIAKAFYFFLRFYLFLERGEGKAKERETLMCGCLSHAPYCANQACNPGMSPDWESNWQPFDLQVRAQSTELHQPVHWGLLYICMGLLVMVV